AAGGGEEFGCGRQGSQGCVARGEDRGESQSTRAGRGGGPAQDQRSASAGGLFVRRSKRILGADLLEDDRVGSRERSGLRLPFRRTPWDWERVRPDRRGVERSERDG